MLAIGSLLVGVGILLAGLLAVFFRHPRAPRWTRPEMVSMLAVVPVTGVLGFGFGYVFLGSYRLLSGAGESYELAAPAGVALVVAGLVFRIRRRLRAYAAESGDAGVDLEPAAASIPMAGGPPDSTPKAA